MNEFTENKDDFIFAELDGIIEVDTEGLVHCKDVLFADAMAPFEGCHCLIKKFKANNSESKDKYPYFGFYPYSIDCSIKGQVEKRDDERLYVGRYLFPLESPSDITVGTAIEIQRIRPFVKKGERCIGNILKYRVIEFMPNDKVEADVCFLLDTNVFIKCPTIFENIDAKRPAIVERHVLAELDGLKKSYDVTISRAAQRAHEQIREAHNQKKVVYAESEPPYFPFKDQDLTMDQKILATAFLEQFKDSTVVFITDDKNCLLQAESVQVQSISLDDFLNGNYSIKRKDPDLNIPGLETIKKTSQYKENLKKDLARKYDEYTALFDKLGHDAFGEFLDYEGDDSVLIEYRDRTRLNINSISLSLLLFYDGVMHCLLFADKNGQGGKKELEEQGFTFRKHSSEEIYNVLARINPDVVQLLIDDLDCSLGTIRMLKDSILNKQKEAFVKTLDYLSCDLSLLHFIADYVLLILGSVIGIFCEPQAVYDFIFHNDYGKIKESILEGIPEGFKDYMKSVLAGEPLKLSVEQGFLNMDKGLIQMLGATKEYIDSMEKEIEYFPFERKYIEDFYSNPDLKPYWEKILNEPVPPIRQETPKVEEPKEEKNKPVELHWPSDKELLGYDNNYNPSEYFAYTIFGSARYVKASVIKKLYEVLLSEHILEDDIETQLIFLSRYSGKMIPGIVLKPLKWTIPEEQEKALGYLILKTANAVFAKVRDFFYFDCNGKRQVPDRELVAKGAHAWDILGPQGASKKPLKMKLDAFLEHYEE